MKFLNELGEEKRKVRWSNSKKSTKVFVATLITIGIFILVISLFSWLVALVMP